MLTPGRNRINATIRFNARFQTTEGVLFDPDTLTAKLYSPSALVTTFTYPTDAELSKTSTGLYYLDYAPDKAGRWHIRWTAVESGDTIILEDDFIVQTSPFVDSSYDWRGDYQ